MKKACKDPPTGASERSWRAMSALALVGIVVLAAGCSTPDSKPQESPTLAGTWRSKVQFNDGAFAPIKDLEFLYVFNTGGTMTESSNYDGAPPVPPAYGIWTARVAGTKQFEAKYTYFNSKAPARFEDLSQGGGWLPGGRGELTERFTLASDGQTFQSEIVLQLYDPAGQAIEGGGRAFGHGTRIQFASD